jgi:hypothetical protein
MCGVTFADVRCNPKWYKDIFWKNMCGTLPLEMHPLIKP